MFRTRDEAGQDDKLLCVPLEDPNWNEMDELEDVPETLRTEIEHFWSIYKEPEGKPVEIQGWADNETARCGIIEDGAPPPRRRSVAALGVDHPLQRLARGQTAHVLAHALGEVARAPPRAASRRAA